MEFSIVNINHRSVDSSAIYPKINNCFLCSIKSQVRQILEWHMQVLNRFLFGLFWCHTFFRMRSSLQCILVNQQFRIFGLFVTRLSSSPNVQEPEFGQYIFFLRQFFYSIFVHSSFLSIFSIDYNPKLGLKRIIWPYSQKCVSHVMLCLQLIEHTHTHKTRIGIGDTYSETVR